MLFVNWLLHEIVLKLPRFSSRELFLITVIVALAIALFYKRTARNTLDLSYPELRRIVMQIDPNNKLQGGGGGTDKAELNILVPSASAVQFKAKFQQEIDQAIDKAGWKRSVKAFGDDHFYYYLNILLSSRMVDVRLVHHREADSPFKKAFPDYDWIEIYLINVQTNN